MAKKYDPIQLDFTWFINNIDKVIESGLGLNISKEDLEVFNVHMGELADYWLVDIDTINVDIPK